MVELHIFVYHEVVVMDCFGKKIPVDWCIELPNIQWCNICIFTYIFASFLIKFIHVNRSLKVRRLRCIWISFSDKQVSFFHFVFPILNVWCGIQCKVSIPFIELCGTIVFKNGISFLFLWSEWRSHKIMCSVKEVIKDEICRVMVTPL